MRGLDVELVDSVIDPDGASPVAQYKTLRGGRRRHYRVFLYLRGPDVPLVQSVTYHLHETFGEPTREVRRTMDNRRCKLTIWTWGLFLVRATVTTKDRSRFQIEHDMGYDADFDREDLRWEQK